VTVKQPSLQDLPISQNLQPVHFKIGGQFLNQYMPKYNLGYVIIGLAPLLVVFFTRVKGVYRIRVPVTKILTHDPCGVIFPVLEYKENLEEILKSISSKHFTISDEILISLYTRGLSLVNKRFWTTTYLTSGFWAHGRADVKAANIQLLDRLKNTENKDIKRVFY
jgi:hypothetical protein